MQRWSLLIAVVVFMVSEEVGALTITPVEMRGLRDVGGGPFLLDFSAVKPQLPSGLIDRTVAHFDISGVTTVSNATLNLGISHLDPDPPDGSLDVYVFSGDGLVSTDEWAAGTLAHTFSGISGQLSTLTVDITALFVAAVGNGDAYLSFNLGTVDSDRYWLSHTIGGVAGTTDGAGPTFISLVPEPSAALLVGLGLLAAILAGSDRPIRSLSRSCGPPS
jgi:hypothetical protein